MIQYFEYWISKQFFKIWMIIFLDSWCFFKILGDSHDIFRKFWRFF